MVEAPNPAEDGGWPDPDTASTSAEFVDALRRLTKWVGLPARELEKRASAIGQVLPRSTLSAALSRSTLPREDLVVALVRACGGGEDQVRRWVAARRRIAAASPPAPVPQPGPAPTAADLTPTPVRYTLPAAQAVFVGRDKELEQIVAAVTDAAHQVGGVIAIHAIDGMPGIGKTTLAVHIAHRLADRFDRRLFMNLHAHTPGQRPVRPGDALAELLSADGVDPRLLPVSVDGRAALWRDRTAGQRLLLVLDNARDTAQVRPLLPGSPGCLVIVTSRNQMPGLLAAHGAYSITVDMLSPEEAKELLARRISMDRVTAEPAAVDQIVTACAGLPLALAIVAARAAIHPHLPLHALANELTDSRARLDMLTTEDPYTDVRAVFSWSYQALTPEAAQLFRLLAQHPGPEISARAAASLVGSPISVVRRSLTELTGANLLTEPRPGRYSSHDLLRAYATEQVHIRDTDQQRHLATCRVLDHYLHTAYSAARLLEPARDPITVIPAQPGVVPEHIASNEAALEWFTAEHPVLLTAVDHAAANGYDSHAWQLATALWTFLDWRGHWHDLIAVQQKAVACASRLGNPTVHAHAHLYLARACNRLGRYNDSHTQLQHALELYRRIGDQTGQAHTHNTLAEMWEQQNRYSEAIQHAQQALQLYQATDHRYGQAHTLNNIGWYHAQLGDHPRALTNCEQALILHQELNNQPGQAVTWDSLGYAHHHLGHHAEAITCYLHALDLFRDLGHRYHEATALTHLGDTFHLTGDFKTARQAWQNALTILRQIDHPDAQQVRARLTAMETQTDSPG